MLAELSAFYKAFSYQPNLRRKHPIISPLKPGFHGLSEIEGAFANECGDTENAEITAKAAKTFNDEHLAKFTEQIAKSLASSGIDYLELAKQLLKRVGKDKDKKIRQILPVLGEES